jgi:hypothetical protein
MKEVATILTPTIMKLEAMAIPTRFGPIQDPMLIGRDLSMLAGTGRSEHSPLELEGTISTYLTNLDPLALVALIVRGLIIGKTALMLALCRTLHPKYNIAALTNDIFTQEVIHITINITLRTENSSLNIMPYRMTESALLKLVLS